MKQSKEIDTFLQINENVYYLSFFHCILKLLTLLITMISLFGKICVTCHYTRLEIKLLIHI